jgi:2-amino-4-hydroxy-6-hydroxymethyldihydropteridine diphosphokinase
MLEKQAKKTYLGLGSNLGNKKRNIEFAKFLLQQNKKFKILKTSSFYKTKSWPNYKDPFFLNIVIEGKTTLKPLDLFIFVKQIELKLGRKKSFKNAPRECDIDILDYDQKVFKIKNKNNFICIPHQQLHRRNFVLLPLFEISKTWVYPKKNKKISDLLNNLGLNNLRTIKLI